MHHFTELTRTIPVLLLNLIPLYVCLSQIATVEVPEEYMGSVVELLGRRRGQMFDMQGLGYVICCYIEVHETQFSPS